jgi:hypothetical protein
MDEPTFLHVFMSYRREDAAGHAGRLYDSLTSRLDVADVFMDVGDIEPGVDFTDAIAHAVEKTDVMLALIGPRWATAETSEGRRRLDNPDDYVVAEIGEALERDVRVIPAIFDGRILSSPRTRGCTRDGLLRCQRPGCRQGELHSSMNMTLVIHPTTTPVSVTNTS